MAIMTESGRRALARAFFSAAGAMALLACGAGKAILKRWPPAPQASASGAPKGGGDPEQQTTLADPAPEGALQLNVETLAEGLVNPWCVAFLPDGAILVTERPGRLRVIRDGALVDEPVAGVPEVVAWNQGGLFDVTGR